MFCGSRNSLFFYISIGYVRISIAPLHPNYTTEGRLPKIVHCPIPLDPFLLESGKEIQQLFFNFTVTSFNIIFVRFNRISQLPDS